MLRSVLAPVLLAVLAASLAVSADKKKDEEPGTRSVQGVVRDVNDGIVEGAVVQLKNTKTLRVRSFITQQDGNYLFRGISANVDFELKAEHGGLSSPVKRLSAFDSRTKAVINLKLEAKR
jgi:hypothetical protein